MNNDCFIIKDGVLVKFLEEKTDGVATVIIPKGVKTIGREAFASCSSIRFVAFPDSLVKIDYYAFLGCINLENVYSNMKLRFVMDNAFEWCTSLTNIQFTAVEEIGYNAFRFCTSLRSIRVESNCKVVYSGAFKGCNNLESAYFPDSLEYIGNEAFLDCVNLQAIHISDNCTIIGEKAFCNCESLNEIVLSTRMKRINDSAFKNSGLQSVTIPRGIKSIGFGSFNSCKKLKNVIIEEGVETIDFDSFSECTSLIKVELPDSLTSIGDFAFAGCSSLKKIQIPNVDHIPWWCFKDCTSLTEVVVSKGVKAIENAAFEGCDNIETITLPYSIRQIDHPDSFSIFSDCVSIKTVILTGGNDTNERNNIAALFDFETDSIEHIHIKDDVSNIVIDFWDDIFLSNNLKRITVDADNQNYSSKNGVLYNKDQTELIRCPSEIDHMDIPDTVKVIKHDAFKDCCLKNVTIPCGVISIEDYAFYGSGLERCVIPESVTNIGYAAFDETPWLSNKETESLLVTVNGIIIAEHGCNGKCVITDARAIGAGAFEGSSITSVSIPDTVESIGEFAFRNCDYLTQINLPPSLKYISPYAFAGAKRLFYIDVDGENGQYSSFDGVLYKGDISSGNASLYICPPAREIIKIPERVTSIEDVLICMPDSNLKELFLPDSVSFENGYLEKCCRFIGGEPQVSFTIFCHKGSNAEKFAVDHSIHYEIY